MKGCVKLEYLKSAADQEKMDLVACRRSVLVRGHLILLTK